MSERVDGSLPDHADVKVPPPLAFGGTLALSIWFQSYWRHGDIGPMEVVIPCALIFLVSLIAIAIEARRHGKSGSDVKPWKPTTVILDSGLYAYSRNPIYVGMAICYVAVAVAAGSYVAILALPFVLLVIRYHVIAREEAYLERKFGDIYLGYKNQVGRWF